MVTELDNCPVQVTRWQEEISDNHTVHMSSGSQLPQLCPISENNKLLNKQKGVTVNTTLINKCNVYQLQGVNWPTHYTTVAG